MGDWYDRPRPIDVRYVDGDPFSRKGKPTDGQRVWLRADGRLPDDPVAPRLHRHLRQRHDAARHDRAAVRPGLGQPGHADGEPRPRDVVPPAVPGRRVAAVRPARARRPASARGLAGGAIFTERRHASSSASCRRAWPGSAGEAARGRRGPSPRSSPLGRRAAATTMACRRRRRAGHRRRRTTRPSPDDRAAPAASATTASTATAAPAPTTAAATTAATTTDRRPPATPPATAPPTSSEFTEVGHVRQPGRHGPARRRRAPSYVVEQDGASIVRRRRRRRRRPCSTSQRQVSAGGEQGLLGLAFAPDGSRAYVDYTDRDGNTDRRRVRRRRRRHVDPATAPRGVLFEIDQPYANHNGGELAFGPDGFLYIGMGDGGAGGDPERHGHEPRRAARQDPAHRSRGANGAEPYTIPPDNPFVGVAGARPEIWSYGLRNPWRFSFDRADRRPVDRRRRPERVRGGRRRPADRWPTTPARA